MFVYKLAAGLAAIAVGVAVTMAVPGFAPEVEASLNPSGIKSDRLDSRPISTACLPEAWPYGCQWRAPAEPRAKRIGAAGRDRGLFHRQRVHANMRKHRVASRPSILNATAPATAPTHAVDDTGVKDIYNKSASTAVP